MSVKSVCVCAPVVLVRVCRESVGEVSIYDECARIHRRSIFRINMKLRSPSASSRVFSPPTVSAKPHEKVREKEYLNPF